MRAGTIMNADLLRHDGALIVELSGNWDLEGVAPKFGRLVANGGGGPPNEGRANPEEVYERPVLAVDFDATQLGTWDSSLLTFLLQATSYCEAHGLEFREGNLPEEIARLLELARAAPEREIDPQPQTTFLVARIGSWGLAAADMLLESATFVGEVTDSFARLVLLRFRMRWRDLWVVVQANSSGALPIVALIAFLIGMIIAFLGAVVLRRFGAGYFVSSLVGYGMLREMAPLMTGIIVAGRTGAAFAAELGTMKVTEEIDALSTLGISPVDHLVLPRVLGLVMTMPLLTIYAGFVGTLGGLVVAITVLDLGVTQFVGGLLAAVTLSDWLLGVFKGTVFGLIIGLAGCIKGMGTGADAGAVGRAATSAVVLGITLIIAANAVIDWVAVLLDV